MKLLKNLRSHLNKSTHEDTTSGATISVKMRARIEKFDEAYKLLDEYDKKSISDPEELADAGRLRDSIKRLQKNARTGRTSTSV